MSNQSTDQSTDQTLAQSATIKPARLKQAPLQPYYDIANTLEIGLDEAGRGPLFGRLYVAAAILPKDDSFRHADIKDSKKFSSKKKIKEVSDYIKANSIAWSIQYIEAEEIDRINILQAVLKAMHLCIGEIIAKMTAIHGTACPLSDYFLMVDGNQFKPYMCYNDATGELECIRHEMIEGGDNKYTSIAAASILAKVERDEYIADLCRHSPDLISRYHLDTNMGYGTKQHMLGIAEYGITDLHRKSYKPCK
jgi:ribonuclease HII